MIRGSTKKCWGLKQALPPPRAAGVQLARLTACGEEAPSAPMCHCSKLAVKDQMERAGPQAPWPSGQGPS